MWEKAATIKRFEYSLKGSELKKQSDIAKIQYQVLWKVYEFDKKEENEIINNEEIDDEKSSKN